jgi:hypothetical protein
MVSPSVLYNVLLNCKFTYCVANGTLIQKIGHVHGVVFRIFVYKHTEACPSVVLSLFMLGNSYRYEQKIQAV